MSGPERFWKIREENWRKRFSRLSEEEQAVALRFKRAEETLQGLPGVAAMVFGQRVALELFDAYVRSSPALRSALAMLRPTRDGRFLEGATPLETLEKQLIWSTMAVVDQTGADPDWAMDLGWICDTAHQEGLSGREIAVALRRVAAQYLRKDGWPYEACLSVASEFETRDAFERARRRLADSGVRIARAEFHESAFRSWLIEIDHPRPVRLVWDGKEETLRVQTPTGRTFAGMPDWEDRWAGKEQAPEEGVARVLEILEKSP